MTVRGKRNNMRESHDFHGVAGGDEGRILAYTSSRTYSSAARERDP